MFSIVHLDANYLVANSVKKSAKLTLVPNCPIVLAVEVVNKQTCFLPTILRFLYFPGPPNYSLLFEVFGLRFCNRQNDGLTHVPLDIIPSLVCLVRKLGYHRIYQEELAAMSSHYNLVLR